MIKKYKHRRCKNKNCDKYDILCSKYCCDKCRRIDKNLQIYCSECGKKLIGYNQDKYCSHHCSALNVEQSEETRLKHSIALKNKPKSKEHKKNLSLANIGKKVSIKTKKKLRMLKLGKTSGMKNKKHSNETRRNMRISHLKRVRENILNGFQLTPWYNKNACKIMEKLNEKYNFNFVHAMNGGEIHLKDLGYFLDGYDNKNNITLEYYEKHHYDKNGKLKKKELNREKEIIKHLNCKLIRINAFDKNNIKVEII